MRRSCPAFPNPHCWKEPGFLTPASCSFPAAIGNNFHPSGNVNHSLFLQYWQPHKQRMRGRTCSGIFSFRSYDTALCYHNIIWGKQSEPVCKVSAKAGRFHSWPETNPENLEMQLDPLQNRLHLTNITQVRGKVTNYNW